MTKKPSELEVRIRDLAFWYPVGFVATRVGMCDVCRRDVHGMGRLTNGDGEDQIEIKGRMRWVLLCLTCWDKWHELNYEHLVAWRLRCDA